MKKVNLETITDTQSWFNSHSVDTILFLLNENFSGDRMEFTRVSRAVGKVESQIPDNSLEFGKSCEGSSWNHCTSTPIDPRQMVQLKEGYAEKKRRYVCSIVAIRLG